MLPFVLPQRRLPFAGMERCHVQAKVQAKVQAPTTRRPPPTKRKRLADPPPPTVLTAKVQAYLDDCKPASTEEQARIASLPQHINGQANAEWLQSREGKVTGSMVGSLAGLNRYRSKRSAVIDMVWPGKFTSNDATRWGNEHEDTAQDSLVEYLQDDAGAADIANPGLVLSDEIGWAAMSPDGIWTRPDGVKVLLEYKCPFRQRYKVDVDDEYLYPLCARTGLPIPIYYYCQIQWGMFVMHLRETIFLVWCPAGENELEGPPRVVKETTHECGATTKWVHTSKGLFQATWVKYNAAFVDGTLYPKAKGAFEDMFVPASILKKMGCLEEGRIDTVLQF